MAETWKGAAFCKRVVYHKIRDVRNRNVLKRNNSIKIPTLPIISIAKVDPFKL